MVTATIKLGTTLSAQVLTTVLGTTIAQAIPILIMPVLTRLYTPADFGVFSLYVALATLCSVIATARYEMAVMLPKSDRTAMNLVALSVMISAIMAVFFLCIISLFHSQIASLTGNTAISTWLFIIPVSVFFTGVFQTLSYWSSRKQRFAPIATAKIYQGVALSGVQLALSIPKTIHAGLIIGHISGAMASVIYLFRAIWKQEKKRISCISKARVMSCFIRYKNFPVYSLWGALFDNAAVQMPIFMLSKFYDTELTGIFSLTFRVLNLPALLISVSLSQVLFQKISHLYNTKSPTLHRLIVKIFFILLALSLPFVFIIFFWGESLFTFVLGDEWALSGKYASMVIFAVTIRFAVSPLSTVLALNHNVKLGFLWQFTYFCTIVTTLYIAAKYDMSIFVLAFVIHEVILYLFYFYLILIGAKRH